MQLYRYLALGDSYTIGEQVKLSGSFPYQTVQLLRSRSLAMMAPEIIAVTGYTTDELMNEIDQLQLLPSYDVVSLLIGVNNQYRGGAMEVFEKEFIELLQRAIQLAGGNRSRVVVLSIPDWGVTPFAADRNREQIAEDIDAFNAICRNQAALHQTHFIDITTSQRADAADLTMLAGDQLHPSAKEYAKWALQLSEKIAAMRL